MANKMLPCRFFFKTVVRRMIRTPAKSALLCLTAVLLLNAYGQMLSLTVRYRTLCENTRIDASFFQAMNLESAKSAAGQDFCQSIYYGTQLTAELYGKRVDLILTNDIDRYTEGGVEIEYAAGHDAEILKDLGNIVFISRSLQAMYGLRPGDSVSIAREDLTAQITDQYYRRNIAEYTEKGLSSDNVAALYRDEIRAEVTALSEVYTVAGIVDLKSAADREIMFAPGCRESMIMGISTRLDFAQIRLSSYTRAAALREYGRKLAESNSGSFVMDTEKLDGLVHTLRLLERLCPAAAAVALLIDAAAVLLFTGHATQTIGLMRVMGEKKRRVLGSFLTEQALLSLTGVTLGLGIAGLAVSGTVFCGCIRFAGLYVAAALAASTAGVLFVTRKSPLELLQTKE